jgi:Family of unknown function (DUF6000)
VRSQDPDDVELMTAIRRYVTPGTGTAARYLMLLGGNFMTMDTAARASFLQQLAASARQASDHDLGMLLDSGWRPRLTASWLIGLDRRQQFRQRIGELLLASDSPYAGQGYCLALARFATSADAELLASYLDAYMPQPDKRYDQHWALGALLYLDEQLAADRAGRFLTDGGLWQQWSRSEKTPDELRELIRQLCSAADEAMNSG